MDWLYFGPLAQSAVNMAVAVFCGALIGSERQIRQRLAGLRTNALVSLGAACFVAFSGLFEEELSPTRVGAQVVSGIGFIGGGIIFRHGLTIHGLNTAATLWCSAAVGLIAGAGGIAFAFLATGFIIFINLGLRPLVKWLKRKTRAGTEPTNEYSVKIACTPGGSSSELRHAIHSTLTASMAQVVSFNVTDDAADGVEIEIVVSLNERSGETIETTISSLLVDPNVRTLNWEMVSE